MSESVNLPALGESVTEGTVTRWLKQVGDRVEVDEPLLEVSTDKVDTEIPSPVAGVIEQILVAEDETAEVGAPLAVIGDGSGAGQADAGQADAGQADAGQADAGQAQAQAQAQPAEEAQPQQQEQAAQQPAQQEQAPAQQEQPQPQQQGGSEVTLPALGESVTEGTVTRWLKQVGDSVEVDEPLLEVSTDKVDTEIPSPVAGTVQQILVGEDETAEVGAVLAIVGTGAAAPAPQAQQPAPAQQEQEQEAPQQQAQQVPAQPQQAPQQPAAQPSPAGPSAGAPTPAQEEASAQAPAAQTSPAREQAEQPAQQSQGGDQYVTPLVRKLAGQHGIDLADVQGTGVGGRIRKQDVLDAVEAQKKPAQPAAATTGSAVQTPTAVSEEAARLRGTTEKASRIRRVIGQRMKESLAESAQLTQVTEVDVTRIAALRKKAKDRFAAQNGVKLTFLPFFAKAVAEALKQHPKLNASFDEQAGEITYHNAEHIAIAVDTDKGLLVPVVHDAGNLNLAGLSRKIADLAERTRTNKIGPDELSGGTFTITNIGSFGALFDTPIINQPQVGILGVGTVVKRPMVITDADGNDSIAIRSMAYLSLTYDHRLVDGADAGRFLAALKARLEGGQFDADLGL